MNHMEEYNMQKKMEKRYCFTDQEFQILAGSLGIRSLYGFKPIEPVKTKERELYQEFFKMTKKGFLEASEDGYLVVPEIRELFYYLKVAESVIDAFAVDDSFPEKCVYPGENAVLIEPGGLQGKYFKCSYDLPEEIREQLCEDGVLLSQNVADDILYDPVPMNVGLPEDTELVRLAVGMGDFDTMAMREEMKKCGVRTIIEKRNIQLNTLQKRMFLVERPVYDVILVRDMETTQIFHYSRQLLLELLKEWMEEENLG